MTWTLPTLAAALTIAMAFDAAATIIAATPCASGASVERASQAMLPFLQWRSTETPPIAGMVLLDCIVQSGQRLDCAAPNHTQSPYDLSGAALAFASALEVCPGTPHHLVFPLVFRADESATPSPSP